MDNKQITLQQFIKGIPDVKASSLTHVFETLGYKHKANTLWLEFGVASGRTINYISKFTDETVYGFDSFEGLPEKWRDGFDAGAFHQNGVIPKVNINVKLIKGWFNDTLPAFLNTHRNKKVSFIHIDCDLYSSTKYVLDALLPHIDDNCMIVFDELVNYPGYDGDKGELKAWYEFVKKNNVQFEWIGMNGSVGDMGYEHENVAARILSIGAI